MVSSDRQPCKHPPGNAGHECASFSNDKFMLNCRGKKQYQGFTTYMVRGLAFLKGRSEEMAVIEPLFITSHNRSDRNAESALSCNPWNRR